MQYIDEVKCTFLCGANSSDYDPWDAALDSAEIPERCERARIRWGSGAAKTKRYCSKVLKSDLKSDWFCERVYLAKYAHLHPDRRQFKKKMGIDKDRGRND